MAETVQDLLSDLWGEIRPLSPTIRPAGKPVASELSPNSPVSPERVSKTIRPPMGEFSPGFRPDSSLIRPVQSRMDSGFSPNSPVSPGGDSGTLSPLEFAPLTEHELAHLIVQTAAANGLDPMALWTWLDLDSIEALRSGSPTDIRAFRVMVSLPTWDPTPPPESHGLPFPGGVSREVPGHPEPERGATGSAGGERGTAGPVCCGDCQHFERDRVGFGQGVGRCGLGHRPPGPALYPKAARHCSRFEARGEITFQNETSGQMAEGIRT
jgi:hypothetical protein